jgi:hypothetical protein
MRRFSQFASIVLAFGLAGCVGTVDTGDKTACYDTGNGIKCVPYNEVPDGTPTVCEGGDGPPPGTANSDSSAEGPSPSDDDTSVSSDTGNGPAMSCTADGCEDSNGDPSGPSDSESSASTPECGASTSDSDGDGVPNGQDCVCGVTPPGDPTPPPGDPAPPA